MAALGVGSAAQADITTTLRADALYEYDSNIYAAATPQAANGGTGASYIDYGGGLSSGYTLGRQSFNINLQGHQLRYQGAAGLNHEEYLGSGDWEWKLGPYLGGSAAVNRSQEMVPFTSYFGTTLSIQTNQNEHFTLDFNAGRNWRLETGVSTGRSDSPRPGLPNLREVDKSGTAALQFVGFTHLSAGVSAQYSEGHFDDAMVIAAPYRQRAAQFSLNYTRSLSTFSGSVGYSSRDSLDDTNNASGTTGSLSYHRDLTARTSMNLNLSRAISSYITNAGAEVDSTAGIQLNYKLTRLISLTAGYAYTASTFPAQGTGNGNRVDHSSATQVNAQYQMSRWLALNAFAHFSSRSSDLAIAKYSDNAYGISAAVSWQALGAR